MEKNDWRLETLAVAAGRDTSPGAPLNVPPTFASTFRDGGGYGYGRWGNPTWTAFEEALGALEGGGAVAFSCGQAATSALVASLPLGATVVYPTGSYLGTRGLLLDLEKIGRIRLRPVDITETAAVVDQLGGADLVWLESPTNPLLGVVDLPVVLGAARDAGVFSVVDNTFATPLLQRPLTWGANAVAHSATKYLGGHSDLLLGAVVTGDRELRDQLLSRRTLEGAIPGTMEAFLALRGLRTLPVRFARQQQTAGVLAHLLTRNALVKAVRYPGLVTDPYHERARAHMAGFGAMLSFDVDSAERADRLVSALELIVGSTSLGGVETTIDRRSRWRGEDDVPAGLLRLSVGLEHPDDLWADLEAALGHAAEEASGG